MNRVR
jgi:hypothetical protein